VKRISETFGGRGLGKRLRSLRQWFTALSLTKALGFVAVFALAGLVIWAVHAATGSGILSLTPQSGQLCGNASVVPDNSAIGGSTLEFGTSSSNSTPCNTTDPTPTNLQVFTGGDNIALVWNMPSVSVQSVQVWRDDQQIATVSPNNSVISTQNQMLGKEYDDNSVTAGSTYQYKVRAVLADGSTSDFTPVVTATQPTNSMPVPNVTVDTTGISSTLASYMQTYIVPLLKTWYPKDANELAYPSYTPPTNITIKFVAGIAAQGIYCDTTASGSSSTVTCDPDQVMGSITAPNQGAAAAFVHETTHTIQDNAVGPGWAIEGGASWSSDFFARQNINNYVPHSGDQIASYTPGAWFIEFMRENYNANFPRDLNMAIHNNTYSDNLFSQDTGGRLTSQTQAWQTAVNAYNTPAGSITGIGGKCVEVQNGTVANGTKLVLNDCNSQSQRLVTNAIFKPGVGSNLCLDDNAGSGTQTDIWDCVSGAVNESWTVTGNGEVIGEGSHKCLTNQGGVNASGNPVILSSCTGDASQLWTVDGNIIKNTATGLCLTDPGASTNLGTATTAETCNGAADQKWTLDGQTTVNGDLTQQWALTYHSTSKTGLFEITSPTLGNVTGRDYCMDDQGGGTADGTSIQYWSCDQTNAQYWTYDASNNTVTNLNANKCLSTQNGGSANGTQLVIRTCDGGADQKWTVPN